MVTLTEKAKVKILELRETEGKNDTYNIRVGVEGGGCSGLSYKMNFDDQTKDTDTVCDFHEIKVLIDKKSLLYLFGTELDYSDGLNGKGFVWTNPNSTRECGCGESFSV